MKRILRPLLLLTLLAILSAVVAAVVIPSFREIEGDGRYYFKECNNFQEHKCVDED